ncbi:MAG: T9SS type A sorting domain-containing protein [Paludibacteraceae bacterium]|nr:T9SS type A sorting domain-containing protein [Paludibacteraceae bacterium]
MKTQSLNFRLFLAFFFISLTPIVIATNYYASPSGNGTGTYSSPFSLSSGISKLQNPGDTLFLLGGIYYQSAKISISKTGTSTSRICIMAYPGEKPILDFRAQPYGKEVTGSDNVGVSISATSNYLHIKGIKIQYAGKNGLINNGSYNIIENCEFYANCDAGLQHKTGYGNLIKNCDSHDNFDYKTGDITLANFGGNADGFADKQYTTTSNGNTYEGCRSWHNADDGWDFYQRVGTTTIKNSICYQMGPSYFDMTNNPRVTGIDSTWFKQFPKAVTNTKGGTDTIKIASYKNYGNGNGFKLGGDYTVNDVTLTNCIAVANAVRGFDQNNNYGTMTVYNASSYLNGYNYGFANSSGGAVVIKNSLSLSSINSNEFTIKSVTTSNNSWNTTGVSCTSADFASLDTTLILSARNSDGSLDSTAFMRLASTSNLINAGINVGLAYSGTAPDLGCYEYGTVNQYPATITTPANATQSVVLGYPINNIVYIWGGGATGLTVTGLPDGVTSAIDGTAKTITLTGTPNAIGSYNYTISSVGGTGNAATVTAKIVVSSASAKKIAYVTTPNSAADSVILNKLQSNPDFNIEIINATTTSVDYSKDSLIIISPVPGSSALGLPAIESLNKPQLLLKPFLLKNTVWNWGTAANTALTTDSIVNKSHVIFSNLTFTGSNSNELQLFSQINSNSSTAYAVTGISSWVGSPSVSILGLGTGTSSSTQSVVEVPVGTNMNGTTTKRRFLMIGVSEYSTAYLTNTATQLIENACYYLMGMDIPTTTVNKVENSDIKLIQQGSTLIVKSDAGIKSIQLISVSGIVLAKASGNAISVANLPTGAYIAQIVDNKGNVYTKKLIKRN